MRFAAGFALFVASGLVGAVATYLAVASWHSRASVALEARTPPAGHALERDGDSAVPEAPTQALRAVERIGSRIDAVERLAGTDLEAALDAATALGVLERRLAVERIAAVAARRDPRGALAVDTFADSALRRHWEASVLAAWARDDAQAALAYVVAATPKDSGFGELPVDVLLAAAPEALLAAIDELPFMTNRELLRVRAFEAFAGIDPEAALQRIVELHPVTREDALAAVARALARRDGPAALAWARGIEPRSVVAEAAVLAALAERYFDAAVGLALALPGLEELASATVLDAASDGERLRALASRLAAAGGAHAAALPRVLRKWGRIDAQAALDWLLASGTPLTGVLAADMASASAQHDVEAATRAVDLIPAEVRGDWIAEVARVYGRKDAVAAATWLARFERDPRYADWQAAVIESAAHADPRTALRLLEARGTTPELARTVAAAWAEREPVQAALWALGQEVADTRMSAFAGVANVWVTRDRDGFADWLSRQPAGPVRDLGLAYLEAAAKGR